jgi:hypothetical protein
MTVLPIFMKIGNTVPTKTVSNREKGAWYNIHVHSLPPILQNLGVYVPCTIQRQLLGSKNNQYVIRRSMVCKVNSVRIHIRVR